MSDFFQPELDDDVPIDDDAEPKDADIPHHIEQED